MEADERLRGLPKNDKRLRGLKWYTQRVIATAESTYSIHTYVMPLTIVWGKNDYTVKIMAATPKLKSYLER